MTEKKIKYLYISLLLLIAIVVVHNWYKYSLPIGYGDEYWLVDPALFFKQLIYLWSTHYYTTGWLNYNIPQLFPITFFWVALRGLGLSRFITQYIWFVLINFLPGLSCFLLIEYISKKYSTSANKLYFSSFVGSLFYSYNLVLVQLLPYQPHFKPALIGAPLVLLFTFKYLESRETLKYAVCLALTSLIFAESNINIAYTIPVYFLIVLALVYNVIKHHSNLLKNSLFLLLSVFLIFLVNLWWIFPYMLTFTSTISTIQESAKLWQTTNTRDTIDYFRLIGFWGWEAGTPNYDYFPFHATYENLIFLPISFCFFLLALLGVIFRPNKYTKFFFVLLTLGIFLAKGENGPLAGIFLFMFTHLPLFWVFRDPFSKFSPYLILSVGVLMGISLQGLLEYFDSKKFKYLIYILMPFCVLLIAYPVVFGLFINKNNQPNRRSYYVDFPDYVLRFGSKNLDNVMVGYYTPYGSDYDWKKGFSGDPFILFANNNIFESNTTFSAGSKLFNNIYSTLLPHNDPRFKNFLSWFSVKKIVLPNDLLTFNYEYRSVHEFLASLYKQEIDGRYVYLDVSDPTPMVYTINSVVSIPAKFSDAWRSALLDYAGLYRTNFYSVGDNNSKHIASNFVSSTMIPIIPITTDKDIPSYLNSYRHDNSTLVYKAVMDKDSLKTLQLKVEFDSYVYNGEAEPFHDFKLEIVNSNKIIFSKDYKFKNTSDWQIIANLNLEKGDNYILYTPNNPAKIYDIDVQKPSVKRNLTLATDGTVTATDTNNYILYEIPNYNSNKQYIMEATYDLLHDDSAFVLSQEYGPLDKLEQKNIEFLYLCMPPGYSPIKCDGIVNLPIIPKLKSQKAYVGFVMDRMFNLGSLGQIKLHNIRLIETIKPSFLFDTPVISESGYKAVQYKNIDPTLYQVSPLTNLKADTILVFTNAFHSAWKLKIGNQVLPEDRHIVVNGYANGWILKKSDMLNQKIEIYFVYQKYFVIVYMLSIIVSILCLLILSFFIYERFFKKK